MAMANMNKESKILVVPMLNLSTGSSEYLTPLATLSCIEHPQSGSSASTINPPSSSIYSTRIQSMMESRSTFNTVLEFDIEYSKDHWTELDSNLEFEDNIEYSPEADREYFEILKQHAHWANMNKESKIQVAPMLNLSTGSSEYLIPLATLSCIQHPQSGSSASTINPPSSSIYSTSSSIYSTRIQSMMESRSTFNTALEFDIEYSKDHWTELDSNLESEDDIEYSPEADRKYFEILKQHAHWGDFFEEFNDLVVGEKIGEGAQADIYEAQRTYNNGRKSHYYDLVVKVMKSGYALRSLRKQWPLGMLNFAHSSCDLRKNPSSISGRTLKGSLNWIKGGTLLKDERVKDRFAFVMDRWWGDLRKLIDLRMQRKNNQGPPFNNAQVFYLMRDIAWDMESLHSGNSMILHRDLKASNVLIFAVDVRASDQKLFNALVIDYECSVGVIGTRFWRAPEILQQLKDGISGSNLNFTSKVDVYSYGMTCYEIVTGHMPFEDILASNFDYVLSGHRPKLPSCIDPLVKEIITRCWHHDPVQRPSFKNIHTLIRQAINGRHQNRILWEPCKMIENEKKSEQQMKECKEEREEWERKWEEWVKNQERLEGQKELKEWMKLKGRCKYWDKWADLKKSKWEWHGWKHRWEEWEELKRIVDRWKYLETRLEKQNEKLKEFVEWNTEEKKWEELKKIKKLWKDLKIRQQENYEKLREWVEWEWKENQWKQENREMLSRWERWGKREWNESIEKKRKWWKEWKEWTSFVLECTIVELS